VHAAGTAAGRPRRILQMWLFSPLLQDGGIL